MRDQVVVNCMALVSVSGGVGWSCGPPPPPPVRPVPVCYNGDILSRLSLSVITGFLFALMSVFHAWLMRWGYRGGSRIHFHVVVWPQLAFPLSVA